MGWSKGVTGGGLGVLVGLQSYLLSGVGYIRLEERSFGLDFGEEDGESKGFTALLQHCEAKDSDWLCPYLPSLSQGGATIQALLALSLLLTVLSLLHSVLTPCCVRRMASALVAGGPLSHWITGWPRCLTICQGVALLNPVVAIAGIVLYPVISRFPEISQALSLQADTGLIVLAVEAGMRLFLYCWLIVQIVENRRQNSRLLEEDREGLRLAARLDKTNSDDTMKAIIPPAASADETRL